MSYSGSKTRARCASVLSLLLASGASAQVNPYSGDGFVSDLGAVASGGGMAFFDALGHGVLDLAHADAGGTLRIHERFAEHAETFTVPGIDACAVSRGAVDRLFGLSQGGLVELVRNSSWSAQTVTAAGLASATVLRSADRPTGPRLLVIDQAGARASVLAPESGFNVLVQIALPGGEGVFHDLAVLDWNGDAIDDLAVVTSAGLRIYNATGALMMAIPAAPQGAFLDVVSGADTQWGNDLLVYQYRESPTSPTALLILNAFHSEVIHADVLQLDGVVIADVNASARPELILPRGDHRSAAIFKQATTTTEAAAIFFFDSSDVNLIDLSLEEASVPAAPPATAAADIDGDGDEDVLFADDRGLGLVLASAWFDADERRASPQDPWSTPYLVPTAGGYLVDYFLELDVPSGASEVEVEVWFQPDPEDPTLAAAPVYTFVMPSSEPQHAITFETESAGGVYHLMYRPIAPPGSPEPPFPVWVALWSPDSDVHAELTWSQPLVYAWSEEISDGPGGTVRRPKIDPGAGTGGASASQ